jgi:iron complex transport system substrate-binding protein
LILTLAVLAARAAAAPIVISDAAHRSVSFQQTPRRIVSLVPSLTESVCELGECARLVATDRFSNWPDSVRGLPKAGGLDDVQVEQVVRVRPDVVLLSRAPRILQSLQNLGVAALEFDIDSYDDIARNITTLGALLAVPERAQELNAKIERSVAGIAAATRARLGRRAPLVYFEVDEAPYGAGPDSFIGVELARLGARNILPRELGPFPKVNPEFVVRANPDIIFIDPAEAPHLASRPGWLHIRAVSEQRLCSYGPEIRDTIVRPGPRIASGLEALANCLTRAAP